MDDEEVMELAEKFWLDFRAGINISNEFSEEVRNKLYEVFRIQFKIAFFIGYNVCEEKENPTLSFAKTTLRNLYNGGKIKF